MSIFNLTVIDFLDIFLVAVMVYQVYRILKGTAGVSIFYGIVIIFIFWKIVQSLGMMLLNEILSGVFNVGAVALIVVFQREIRQFLLNLGRRSPVRWIKRYLFKNRSSSMLTQVDTIEAIVKACRFFSGCNVGVLIAIQVLDKVEEFVKGGDVVDIGATFPVLESIFPKSSALHDGAVVIIGDKIVRVKGGLPTADSEDIPKSWGFRHKAAVGLSENTDAICLVVSEESGNRSDIKDQRYIPIFSDKQLRRMLTEDLRSPF